MSHIPHFTHVRDMIYIMAQINKKDIFHVRDFMEKSHSMVYVF